MEAKNESILNKNVTSENPSDLKTSFQPGIYWFRDYWSNRNRLHRNKKSEGLGWEEDSEDFNPELLTEPEIIVEKDGKGYVTLKDTSGQELFKGFVDPDRLIRKFEPWDIVVEDVFGGSLYQLPQSLSYAGAKELPLGGKVFGKMKNPTPEKVYTQKLAHQREKPLGKIIKSLLKLIVSSLFVIVALAILFGFLLNYLPFLTPFYWPAIVIASALYSFWIVSKIIHEKTKIEYGVAFIQFYDGSVPTNHFEYERDIPKSRYNLEWLDSKPYWVFEYIYRWSRELTFKWGLPPIYFKKDLERIELWLDAKTGVVEWAVTDYHYRELWYKVGPDVADILVWIYPNFHTPRFLNIGTKGVGELMDLYEDGTKLNLLWKAHLDKRFFSHGKDENARFLWISDRVGKGFLSSTVASELAKLWWDRWRYPLGADNKKYIESKEPAVGEQPPT